MTASAPFDTDVLIVGAGIIAAWTHESPHGGPGEACNHDGSCDGPTLRCEATYGWRPFSCVPVQR